jgi:hypothetical protein
MGPSNGSFGAPHSQPRSCRGKEALAIEASYLKRLLQARDANLVQNLTDHEPREKSIVQARQPRWEYRLFSIADADEAANKAIAKLVDDGWEYVTVVQPAHAPLGVYQARILFKRTTEMTRAKP